MQGRTAHPTQRRERRERPRTAERLARVAGPSLLAIATLLGVGTLLGVADANAPVRRAPAAEPALRAMSVAPIAPPPAQAPTERREPSALTPALRSKGWNACYMPDPGFGPYARWTNLSMGRMIVPERGGMTEDGGYDVVIHFHGAEAVRHAFAEVADGTVLAGIDLGIASLPYEKAFSYGDAFPELLKSIERGLRRHSRRADAHIRHLALSSWSAGFGAVLQIVRRYGAKIDAVVLLDSLHADYVVGPPDDMHAMHGVSSRTIKPMIEFARKASAGDKLVYLTHSAIVPPGYASTSEVADFLLGEVGGARWPLHEVSTLGATLATGFDRKGLHVRGYEGNDKPAHCAHVAELATAVRDLLEPAWKTPHAVRGEQLALGAR